MYVLGIDAGGTKTQCMIADEKERILGEGLAGPGQHQLYGIESVKEALRLAIGEALKKAGIMLTDISYAVLGMSGADGEEDFAVLVPAVRQVLGSVPFEVVHDAWIGFRAAVEDRMGVVSICGTGSGHAGQNRKGERLTLRNLDYLTGNYGGGGDLAQKALHYAFRSEEGTFDKSELQKIVPSIFGVDSMDEVCTFLRHNELTKEQSYQLPIAVFDLARRGDQVSRMLLQNMGYEEGRYAAAVIRRLGMQEERVPVVLIGSLFKTREPLLLEPFLKAVREAAPGAYPVITEEAPVVGAIKLALDYMGGQV